MVAAGDRPSAVFPAWQAAAGPPNSRHRLAARLRPFGPAAAWLPFVAVVASQCVSSLRSASARCVRLRRRRISLMGRPFSLPFRVAG